MSPEQAMAKKDIDGRSDVYSLGVILFAMLAGKRPYAADTPMGIALAHINEPVPHITDFRKDIPSELEMILVGAMAKRPSKRYATAGEFARALGAFLQRISPEAASAFSPSTLEMMDAETYDDLSAGAEKR